jgi:hypothetical protein
MAFGGVSSTALSVAATRFLRSISALAVNFFTLRRPLSVIKNAGGGHRCNLVTSKIVQKAYNFGDAG